MAGGKRPFWMHQLVEYILGGMLVAMGLQSRTPIVPAVVGGVIMVHTAITKGALAAFKGIDRKVHAAIDPAIIVASIFAGLQPWVSCDNATRLAVVGVAVVHLVVFLGSSFAHRQPRQAASGDLSTNIGRMAGRAAGSGVNSVRRLRSK